MTYYNSQPQNLHASNGPSTTRPGWVPSGAVLSLSLLGCLALPFGWLFPCCALHSFIHSFFCSVLIRAQLYYGMGCNGVWIRTGAGLHGTYSLTAGRKCKQELITDCYQCSTEKASAQSWVRWGHWKTRRIKKASHVSSNGENRLGSGLGEKNPVPLWLKHNELEGW